MYLKDYLSKYTCNIHLYVDMDGVVADYDVGKAYDFNKKRPLTTSINKLEEISKMPNITLYILSVCRNDFQVKEKNDWLNIYAPFFDKENRVIISKESNPGIETEQLKSDYLKNIYHDNENLVGLIDDDPRNLRLIRDNSPHILLLKDSVLID